MNSSYPDTEGPRHIAEIWSPDALPLRARLDFSPVPQSKRGPGRIRSVSIRFRPDRYVEHKHALAFYKSQLAFHGDGTRALVRALLHYRDTITGSSYASVPPLCQRHVRRS